MTTTKDYRAEQQRYQRFAKHLHPVGIAHHMRPKSVELLMNAIGHSRIEQAKVLEIGCGQGYLVNHFLYAGAKHVIGTEIDEQILMTIPLAAYQTYQGENKQMEFHIEDFDNIGQNEYDQKYSDVQIVSMFIGNDKLVRKLFTFFFLFNRLRTIAFMIPTRGFSETRRVIMQYVDIENWVVEEFSLQLSISGEQRRVMVVKK